MSWVEYSPWAYQGDGHPHIELRETETDCVWQAKVAYSDPITEAVICPICGEDMDWVGEETNDEGFQVEIACEGEDGHHFTRYEEDG